MVNVYDAAREYLHKGYSVIPIQAKSKVPAVKWNKFREEKASALDLQSMFAGQDRNIAIVTGPISKLLVVDIDKPELFEEYDRKWHTEMVARTPKGGYHLYYAYGDSDIGNPIGRLSANVDIRANGGYVLAAPSVVKYDTGVEGSYEWLRDGNPTPLPQALHDKIVSLFNEQTFNVEQIAHAAQTNEDGHDLWIRVLRTGFTEGRHNVEVKDIARYLYRHGMNPDVIMNTLATMNYQDKTPLTEYELQRTVTSGINYEKSRETLKTPEKTHAFRVKTLMEVMTEVQDISEEWLIEDWLPAASIVMIAAQPEQFKTWLALEAAVVVAAGDKVKPFLDEFTPPKVGQPVLVIQQEDYTKKVAERVDMILRSKFLNDSITVEGDVVTMGDNPYSIPLYFHTDRELALDDDESMKLLEDRIKELGIKLVIIDPLYSLGNSDDHFAGLARKIGALKTMREKYGTTFVLVHHQTKSAAQIDVNSTSGVGRISIFGSNLLNGAMETLWIIEKQSKAPHERLIARFGKGYNDKMPVMALHFHFDDDSFPGNEDEKSFRVYSSTTSKPSAQGEDGEKIGGLMAEVLKVIQRFPAGISRKDLYELLPDMKSGTVNTYTDRLVERELVTREKIKGANLYLPVEEI